VRTHELQEGEEHDRAKHFAKAVEDYARSSEQKITASELVLVSWRILLLVMLSGFRGTKLLM